MTGTIIYVVISSLVSLIFIVLGVNQFRSKVPVALNTGEVTPREDELTDIFLIVIFAEKAWLEIQHSLIKKETYQKT